jgi:hypothetical protein
MPLFRSRLPLVTIGRAAKDADASVASFAFATAAQGSMAKIDASSLAMKRYSSRSALKARACKRPIEGEEL